MIRIRAAGEVDLPEISALLHLEGLDRGDVEARHFMVAEDTNSGNLVGCGRIKPHADALELTGLVVEAQYRGRGIGSRIVERLLAQYVEEPIYLVTTLEGESYYRRFGFGLVPPARLPHGILKKFRFCQKEFDARMVALVRPGG